MFLLSIFVFFFDFCSGFSLFFSFRRSFRCNPSLFLSLSISWSASNDACITHTQTQQHLSFSSIFKRSEHIERHKRKKREREKKKHTHKIVKKYLTWKLNYNWCKHQSLMYLYSNCGVNNNFCFRVQCGRFDADYKKEFHRIFIHSSHSNQTKPNQSNSLSFYCCACIFWIALNIYFCILNPPNMICVPYARKTTLSRHRLARIETIVSILIRF